MLNQQRRFDGQPGSASEKSVHALEGKSGGSHRGPDPRPPGGRAFPLVNQDAAELTRVTENQSVLFLVENEVIVLSRGESAIGKGQLAGHAKMNAEPEIPRKTKEHLFAAGFGRVQALAGETGDPLQVASAKDPLTGVQMNACDFSSYPGVPLFAEKLDFGKFWHLLNMELRFLGSRHFVIS